jgi:hypothetical protein
MIKTSISYDEGILEENCTYSVGTNDGKEFRTVVYKGTKLLNGKPMMVFKTVDGERLTVNPSFHTFTITENKGETYNG